MNDIEKLSEKLRNHTITPPPESWQTLAQGLHQKRRKKRIAYWWVAAAVLLLGVAITWIGLEKQVLTPRVAQQVVADSITVSKEALIIDSQDVIEDIGINSKGELKLVTETLSKHPSAVSEVSDVEPSLLSDELSIKIPSPSPLATGKKETRVIEEVRVDSEQSTARQPTLIVEASRYRKLTPKIDTLQAGEEVMTRGSAVTVIYQPNPATLAEKKSLGQKIDRTLTFLEEHGIGYSELRLAKSDLVDKLFSGKESQREEP